MTNHEPLTNPDADGFPELVYAMHKALVDLLGDQFDIDYDALAPELADTAWKQLHRKSPRCVECQSRSTEGPDSEGFMDCRSCGATWLPGAETATLPETWVNLGDDDPVPLDPECGKPWTDHTDDGVQMLCPAEPCMPESPSCEAHRSGRSWLLPCPQPRDTPTEIHCDRAGRHEANPDCCVEMRHCDGCGEDYDVFSESHVGHRLPDKSIPCRPIEYPTHQAADVARRQHETDTGRPHETYLCPEMHIHVQEVG